MITRDVSVAEAMSEDVRVALPGMEIQDAARLMAELDIGVLPVSSDGELVGMLTDRDIAVRAVAIGLGPETLVSEIMSSGARYCHAGDRLDKVLEGMGVLQLRRMPVLDRDDRLIGIISLADAAGASAAETAKALEEIAEPGGEHSQADEQDASELSKPVIQFDDESTGSNLLHFTDDDPT